MARLVGPHVLPHGPRLRVVVGGHGPQDGAQVVVDHDLEEGVERVLAPFLGHVGDHPTVQALIGGRVRVTDDVAGEVGQASEDTGLLAVGSAEHLLAHVGVAKLLDALGHG